MLGLIARTYGFHFMFVGLRDPFLERWHRRIRLEHGLIVGGVLVLVGVIGGLVLVVHWLALGAGSLGEGELALLGATIAVAGVQIDLLRLMLSILGLCARRADPPDQRTICTAQIVRRCGLWGCRQPCSRL